MQLPPPCAFCYVPQDDGKCTLTDLAAAIAASLRAPIPCKLCLEVSRCGSHLDDVAIAIGAGLVAADGVAAALRAQLAVSAASKVDDQAAQQRSARRAPGF